MIALRFICLISWIVQIKKTFRGTENKLVLLDIRIIAGYNFF